MKVVAWLFAIATLVGSGAYSAISLGRWEWNRALFFAIVFVAAEVGVAAALVLHRVARLERRLDQNDGTAATATTLATVRAAAADHCRFAWLAVDRRELVNRTNVFITMVVGGGVVLSGAAWVVDRIARSTTDRGREQALAGDLESIAYPHDGILVDDVTVLARSRLRRDDPRVDTLLGRRGDPQ